uniref:Uncharacterized protein n=1 Tax=Tetranychus urticae TaxID=32264 RepID=T1KKK0_TETUR
MSMLPWTCFSCRPVDNDSSSFSSPLSSSTSPQLIPTSNADDGGDNKLHSTPLNHRGSKRKRYQPARYLKFD